jgi:hypothetical protein
VIKTKPDINLNYFFDSHNDLDLNVRITNIINELRSHNKGPYQSFKLTLIDEKNCLADDFKSIFIEDSYKEEQSYINYLCNIHSDLVEKLEKEEYI